MRVLTDQIYTLQSKIIKMPILSSNPIERQAARAILRHAFLRWETQACLFGAVAALLILPGYWKAAAALGLLGALIVISSSLSDKALNAEVAFQELQAEVRPETLSTTANRQAIEEALDYQRKIQQLRLAQRKGAVQTQLELVGTNVGDWLRSMYRFARNAEALQQQGDFAHDLQTLPGEIKALEWQLGRGLANADVVRETLEKKKQSLAALTEVRQTIERAGSELQNALAAIEAVYSQLLRMATASQLPADAVQRLSQDVNDRSQSMKVMADALANALSNYQGAPQK